MAGRYPVQNADQSTKGDSNARTMANGMGLMWHDAVIRLPEPRSRWPSPTNLHYHRVVFEEG